jgi:hypothetical protein
MICQDKHAFGSSQKIQSFPSNQKNHLGFSHEPRLLAFSCVASLIIIKGFTPMEWSSDVTHLPPFSVGTPNCNQEMES